MLRKTLNSEIMKNSSGRVRVAKKKFGSGRVAGTRQTLVARLCFVKQCFARLVLQGYVLNSILCPDDVHMVVMENSTKLFQKSFMGWDVTCLVVKWMTIMGLKIHSKTIMKNLDLQLLVPMPGGRVNEYSWA